MSILNIRAAGGVITIIKDVSFFEVKDGILYTFENYGTEHHVKSVIRYWTAMNIIYPEYGDSDDL